MDTSNNAPTVPHQQNTRKLRNLSYLASIFVIVIYIPFTILAYRYFPAPYSFLRNWLSDLGSYQLNPRGASFYNLGIILSGATLLPYFIGLAAFSIEGHKLQNSMLLLTQVCGCAGALAMVMSAIFPISVPGAHSIWSAALYILLGSAFVFSVAAFRYYSHYPRWSLIVGVLVAVEDIIWSLVLNTYVLEWLTVFLFLGYIVLLGVQTKRMQDQVN